MRLAGVETDLGAYVDERMAHRHVPGVVVGMVQGEEDLVVARGVTSVDHPLEVDVGTLFQIGSRTKTFTGTALMQQVEAGKLHLDAPLVTYLPEFTLSNPDYAPRVTPPVRVGFYDEDCIFDRSEPASVRGKFLREADGHIRHLHWGGRLIPRFEGGESWKTFLPSE
jgi:hypothetical protein